MEYLAPAIQLILGLGILNVWLLRRTKVTPYRGGGSPTLREEFRAYNLPDFFYYIIGALKLTAAALLLFGLYFENLVDFGALLLAALMAGAFAMHLKIRDPLIKAVPSVTLLLLCLVLLLLK